MKENNKKSGIDMRQLKYIASVGHCPKCGSDSVKFRIPFESYLESYSSQILQKFFISEQYNTIKSRYIHNATN